jgi:ADP-ribose pyrophosphatase YjhB (NUDIX family)
VIPVIYRFCPLCALPLVGEYEKGKSFPCCPTGHFTNYLSQIVGVAGIIHDDAGRILLERRAIEPGYGLWALPGGMAEPGEATEECLVREVLEETGLDVRAGRLLAVKGGIKVCIVFHEATVLGGSLAVSAESLALQWFAESELPLSEFAFARHRDALLSWIAART